MNEKRVVSRKVAIALGIICIVLAVLLALNIAHYTLIINEKDDIIASLNSQIAELQNQVSSLQSQVDSLNSHIANLTKITNMEMSTVLVNNESLIYLPSSTKTWGPFSVKYAGLVLVRVETPLLEGYVGSLLTEIKVTLSAEGYKPYISREGTLLLDRTSAENRIKTALFPVADLTFPLRFYIQVTNPSNNTIQLAVTITYVY
jgi:uncharacterized coiled-coil protein SlyX